MSISPNDFKDVHNPVTYNWVKFFSNSYSLWRKRGGDFVSITGNNLFGIVKDYQKVRDEKVALELSIIEKDKIIEKLKKEIEEWQVHKSKEAEKEDIKKKLRKKQIEKETIV